jgi:hypothetical protein
MNCDWVKSNVVLYVYDELADDARYELEQHLERCAGCAAEVNSAREFKTTMSALPVDEPSPNLLASSRMRLQEALEETSPLQGWRRWVIDPTAWLRQMRFSPALAAVLVIIGFAGGVGTTWQIARGSRVEVPGVTPKQQPTAEASIAGIQTITPDPSTGKVEIKYDTLVPQTMQGDMNDQRIQQLLVYAAHNNQNSGLRMDSIDLLAKDPNQEAIRETLMFSLRYDTNPGVRLKALEGLGPYVKTDLRVRNAVLEALMNDSNPGVRTEAINLLKPVRVDSSVRQVLEYLAQSDQNKYIRSQSRAVLAQMPHME